jgi:hypothetical protein
MLRQAGSALLRAPDAQWLPVATLGVFAQLQQLHTSSAAAAAAAAVGGADATPPPPTQLQRGVDQEPPANAGCVRCVGVWMCGCVGGARAAAWLAASLLARRSLPREADVPRDPPPPPPPARSCAYARHSQGAAAGACAAVCNPHAPAPAAEGRGGHGRRTGSTLEVRPRRTGCWLQTRVSRVARVCCRVMSLATLALAGTAAHNSTPALSLPLPLLRPKHTPQARACRLGGARGRDAGRRRCAAHGAAHARQRHRAPGSGRAPTRHGVLVCVSWHACVCVCAVRIV